MGYYLDTFFEKEHKPLIEKWEREREREREREQREREQRGIIDEIGCKRYTMTLKQLQALYKQFENFVADCPQQEYNENKSAIIAVYALIHKHINAEINK